MPFPASQVTPSKQLEVAQITANRIKVALETINAQSLAGPIDRGKLISVMGQLSTAISTLTDVAATPGIGSYAKDQFDDQGMDIAAEFLAMLSAITTLRDWIFDNFPKDASGAWLAQTFNQAGAASALTFTTAALSQYRTNADAVIATIS